MYIASVPLIALAGAAAVAGAQMTGHWAIQIEYEPGSGGVVSPAHPTATVRILAGFTGAHAFAGGNGNLLADDGEWLSLRLLDVYDPPHPPPPGTTPGTPKGSNVERFVLGQPGTMPVFNPSTANPIPLWEGAWTTTDFTERATPLRTDNTAHFSLYDASGRSIPVTPTHGSAAIRVVPSPGAALFGASALFLYTARRSRRARAAG
jgi:hypothetical protein